MKDSKQNRIPTASEVEEFIHRRFKKDGDWMNGNCYYFAVILSTRFPALKIYHMNILGHFIVGDGNGNFYDWTGKMDPSDEIKSDALVLLDDLKVEDPLYYGRLVRDCMESVAGDERSFMAKVLNEAASFLTDN